MRVGMDSRKSGGDQVPATEIKNNFGFYLDASRQRPVEITKNGRTCAVLLAADEFTRLREIEDRMLGNFALSLHRTGDYLSAEESEKYLQDIIKGAGGRRPHGGHKAKTAKAAKRSSART